MTPALWRVALLLVLVVVGCPRVERPVERPAARAERLTIARVDDAGLAAVAHFEIWNRNPGAVVLRAVDWELTVGDSPPARGRSRLRVELGGDGRARIAVPLAVAGRYGVLLAHHARGDAGFRLRGMLHFESARGEVGTTFDVAGAIARP